MKNVKLLLLKIRNKDSLAIRTLHRLLEQEGFIVKSLFAYDSFSQPLLSASDIDLIIKNIEAEKPDVLGISLTSYEFKEAIEISGRIRSSCPETLIVWGGIHPTIAPECCVDYCDFACIGEGENTILEIANLLNEKRPKEELRTIQNLAFIHNDQYFRNPLRPLIDNLDSIPFPDFSHKNKIYLHGKQANIPNIHQFSCEEIYEIMTSRGCPSNCSYCCSPYIRNLYKGYCYLRRRSIDSAIEEIIQARVNQPAIKYIVFADDIFMADLSWVKEFTIKYKLKINLPFRCNGHVNHINEEIIEILKNAGLKEMSVGIQSGSEQMRKEIFCRNTTDKNILRVAGILTKFNIRVIYDLICSQLETQKNKREAFKLFYKIPKPFVFHIHEIAYYINASITQYALQRNLISESDIIGNLQGRTQGIYNPKVFYSNNFIGNDPYYRLLPLFGNKFIPNLAIRFLVHTNQRIVKTLIYTALVFRRLFRFFLSK